MKTIIIIPSRLASSRFPNKPLALIDGIPMIQRVWEQAIKSKIGPVIVACCDNQVFELIDSLGGTPIMTSAEIPSGTDRIYEAIKNYPNLNQYESLINLQGDMPLIDPDDIHKVNIPLQQGFDIGTLVTNLSFDEERNKNITKVKINWIKNNYIGDALDFYKVSKNLVKNIYHHVGIYSFSFNSLKKFVQLEQSSNELHHNLEQLRALDGKMSIGASYVDNIPLSVDTEDDLIKVESIIKGD